VDAERDAILARLGKPRPVPVAQPMASEKMVKYIQALLVKHVVNEQTEEAIRRQLDEGMTMYRGQETIAMLKAAPWRLKGGRKW